MKGFVEKPNNGKISEGERNVLIQFGKKVRKKRLELEYSRLALAKMTSQLHTKIASIENGKHKVTLKLKEALESVLGFTFVFDNTAPFVVAKVHKPIAVDSVEINGLRHKGWVTFNNQSGRKTVAL